MKKFIQLLLLSSTAVLFLAPSSLAANNLRAETISAGGDHSCAINKKGLALCWGDNSHGQLGNGQPGSSRHPVAVRYEYSDQAGKVVLRALDKVVDISAGQGYSCAVRQYGGVFCWGINDYGQLGNGSTGYRAGTRLARPVLRAGSNPGETLALSTARTVSAGLEHSCATRKQQPPVCWGRNFNGELGIGSRKDSLVAQPVINIGPTSEISVGLRHTCAVDSQRQPRCWGWNDSGQLGTGNNVDSNQPQPVLGLNKVQQIASGFGYSCAISSTSAAHCWGDNHGGQLGTGNNISTNAPAAVIGLSGAVDITAGSSHACAINSRGRAVCWGKNWAGQLGIGNFSPYSQRRQPSAVVGLGASSTISAGGPHSCAIQKNGAAAFCWGRNFNNQVGSGSRWKDQPRPQAVRNK